MKKMFMLCATLCFALSLLCVSALAADLDVKVSPVDASAVQVAQKDGSADPIFTVAKSGAQSGQLYLVMIQQGSDASANPKPTKENLYYLNVEEATGDSFSAEAYPRDMAEGSYVVYLSDYSGNNAGKALGVATITVSAKSGEGGGSGGNNPSEGGSGSGGSGEVKIVYGDVDGSGKVNSWDATVLARYLAGQKDYQTINEKNSDCDGNGSVKSWDLTVLYRYLAGQKKYAELPDNPHTGN